MTRDQIRDGRFFSFVFESREKIVGFYTLETLSQDAWELEALFVAPDSMGQGVGACLIGHAKDFATSHGVKKILIQGDPNATGFYQRQLATHVGQRESESIAGRYLPMFEIDLNQDYKQTAL